MKNFRLKPNRAYGVEAVRLFLFMDYLDGLVDGRRGVFVPFAFLKIIRNHQQAMLLSQICYYAAGKNYKPFYKFKMPCDHPAYKKGDSWSEILCMSEDQLDNNLKAICQRLKADEKPEDYPEALVWVKRDKNNVTYYMVNKPLILKLMKDNETPRSRKGEMTDSGNYEDTTAKTPDLERAKTPVRINTNNNIENIHTSKRSDGLGFTDNGNNEVKGNGFVTIKSEEKQSIPPSSAAPPLNYGSRIPKYGQLSVDYFEVQELLKVHPDAVLDLTASTKHTFEELGKTYGIEKVKEVAKWLGESRASQYLPKVVNFIQAEQFAGDLNSMITAKQFAPPKAPSQKTPQHPLIKGPQPKLII